MEAKEREERLQKIIRAISKVAKADGIITPEEQEILESVQINILVYDQSLEDALDDGIISNDERESLNALKHQILNEAWDIARYSEGVSNDEIKMLQVLLRELENADE